MVNDEEEDEGVRDTAPSGEDLAEEIEDLEREEKEEEEEDDDDDEEATVEVEDQKDHSIPKTSIRGSPSTDDDNYRIEDEGGTGNNVEEEEPKWKPVKARKRSGRRRGLSSESAVSSDSRGSSIEGLSFMAPKRFTIFIVLQIFLILIGM